MANWFKGLLGGKSKPAPKKAVPAKSKPADHAAALAEALNVHRRSRAQAQSALEQTFKDLQAKPLNPRDVEGMTRLLSLRKAILSMKGEAGQKSAHVLDDLKATVKPKGPQR